MIGIKVPVAAERTGWRSRAQEQASRFGLPYANETENPDYLLTVNAQGLVLKQLGYRGGVYLDFVRGCSGYRTRRGGGRQQPLARAVGLRQGRSPEVLDVTAGLGRDAFVLASLGCQVVLLERSPVIAALLFDALERALADGPT